MSRSQIRQQGQVHKSDVFDDTLPAGAALETGSTSLQDDLNAIRSQILRIFVGDEAGADWFRDVDTIGGFKRGLKQLATVLDAATNRQLLRKVLQLADIAVSTGQNYKVLSFSTETPVGNAAVSADENGVIVRVLAADVGVHSLLMVAGVDVLNPKNLLQIREAGTQHAIRSEGKEVFGLLQAEAGVVDGDGFNNTDKQVQISFVRENAAGDALEAVPVADIEGKSFNYSYRVREPFDLLPEDALLHELFVDRIPPTMTPLNKSMVALVTSGDGSLATATALFKTPAHNSFPSVSVNGVEYRVGNGIKAGVPCYFSGDGGVTPRAVAQIVVGDELYWNGAVAGFELDGQDRIDFEYEVF